MYESNQLENFNDSVIFSAIQTFELNYQPNTIGKKAPSGWWFVVKYLAVNIAGELSPVNFNF